MFIDTHCHIFSDQFADDADEVIKRALSFNVGKILMPNINRNSVVEMNYLAEKYPKVCYPMMAIHPCDVNLNFIDDITFVDNELATGNYIAVGETGIDLYWDKTFLEQQKTSFKLHLQLGKKYKLPVIIHVRDSFDEIFEVLAQEAGDGLFGIFHCFTGTLEQAKKAIQFNFNIGVGGVCTFKKSHLNDVLAQIDLKNIVLETDAPYLAPTPHRGKRNEPSYIPIIADKLAEIHQLSLNEIEKITTQNAYRIFNLNNENS